ncbi:thiamine-phosphate kinase [Polynucleobacter sphagniphilus]|uniref:thiamine-phosphate kinase n=1 Tax=Polynucleobacter sphagniphilus TaxID=1743169 RepID=UPI002406FA55|nr:thiamine-phosphate kinase [Polynucleobacter sphagniphilus]
MSSQLGEFELIARYFKMESDAMLAQGKSDAGSRVLLGIGDDCAILKEAVGEELAITSDMLVEGRHFFKNVDPRSLGYKALAVNLSDLAAMGAKPLGFTLALALPHADGHWLEAFSQGLFEIANKYTCPLIGGDTTAGPLTISITAFGSIPKEKAIRRSGAKVHDDIWVSGTLGDARLTLAALRHELTISAPDLQSIQMRMHQPEPRITLGQSLQGVASAALDISDGLLGDLMHILEQSHVDAEILLGKLPKSGLLLQQSETIQNQFAACGGDDYELCFTAKQEQRDRLNQISQELSLPLARIGTIKAMRNSKPSIDLIDSTGQLLDKDATASLLRSFDHFA